MTMYYYNQNSTDPETVRVDKNWVSFYGGVDPDTATGEELAAAGYYLITSDEYDLLIDTDFETSEDTYTINGNEASHTATLGWIDLNDAVSITKAKFKSMVYNSLKDSDWMVIRYLETNNAIPTEWNDYRNGIRSSVVTKEAAIDACTTTEELYNYVNSEEYNTWPTQPSAPDLNYM